MFRKNFKIKLMKSFLFIQIFIYSENQIKTLKPVSQSKCNCDQRVSLHPYNMAKGMWTPDHVTHMWAFHCCYKIGGTQLDRTV